MTERESLWHHADLWHELRLEEREAALVGGAAWRNYVAYCEQKLALPWAQIREQFNAMDRAAGENPWGESA